MKTNASLIIPLLTFLFHLSFSATTTTTTTLPLSQHHSSATPPPPTLRHLRLLATQSLSRATHLKNPTSTAIPLSPHSYGGYATSLAFGTPPQPIPFLLDTGSDFVWFPCTHNYLCNNCTSASSPPIPAFHSFIPKLSSTSAILGCKNPKCGWIHPDPDPKSRCKDCLSENLSNCTQICPPYIILYGSGTTGGLALLDTLNLGTKRVPEILVGCSLFSSRQPAGIAGFGRGPSSLPSQLGLAKFSFCLLSHRFDDTRRTSPLNLTVGGGGKKTAGVSYTTFLRNPKVPAKSRFSGYYYVGLRRISVGGKHVKIPYHYLAPADPVTGSGGTMLDSGTTLSYMTRGIFDPMAREFEKQVKDYKRDTRTEELTGLGPCFDLSGAKTLSFPTLTFHFKGGADMILPLSNYMAFIGNAEAACLTLVTDGVGAAGAGGAGPAVILGNFQLQNFYVEYDLKNQRFGFRQQKCG